MAHPKWLMAQGVFKSVKGFIERGWSELKLSFVGFIRDDPRPSVSSAFY
jgi:hypothetical protein